MALKNKSMYAILGMLSLSPCTGYEIKKYSDKVLAGFWNENFGHIYPTLKKMLDDGMIAIVGKEKNQTKIRYEITDQGKQELKTWFKEETTEQPIRSEFMLKLLFSSSRPKEEVIRMIEDYRELHKKKIEKYLGMQQDLEKGIQEISNERAYVMNMILKKGIMSCEAVICWCDETVMGLQERSEFS